MTQARTALVVGGLGIGALLLFFLSQDDDDEQQEPLDEPGTPGGQDPPDDGPMEPPGNGGGGFQIAPPEQPDPGPGPAPWEPPGVEPYNPQVYEHPSNYPTPGKFHQVVRGDTFGGRGSENNLAWAALYEAAYAAAVQVGEVGDDEARAFARSIADDARHRLEYIDLILCSPFNDFLFGTYGFGDGAREGPHGRSIRLLPLHASIRDDVFKRRPLTRNVEMKSLADKGSGSGRSVDSSLAGSFEYLWMPPINLEILWSDRRITTEGLSWYDGSSVIYAPPEIMDLGFEVFDSDRQLDVYGCLGGELEMREA